MRSIDHIVLAVPHLEAACTLINDLTGVQAVFGGRHLGQGTQNALLHLGDACYLEILAVDPKNKQVPSPRWMGVDLISQPRITRWALRSDDLESDQAILRAYHPEMGHAWRGERHTASGDLLSWNMILPLPSPEIELMPFMVDWEGSAAHPAEGLELGCYGARLQLQHPEPAGIQAALFDLGWNTPVSRGPQPRIQLEFQSPKGPVVLG